MKNPTDNSRTGASYPWTEPTRKDIAALKRELNNRPLEDSRTPISLTEIGFGRVWLYWVGFGPDPDGGDIVLATVFPTERV